MPVTVTFDPNSLTLQSAIISDATPRSAGTMSKQQAADLADLVASIAPGGVLAVDELLAAGAVGVGREINGLPSVWCADPLQILTLLASRDANDVGIFIAGAASGAEAVVQRLKSTADGTALVAGFFNPTSDAVTALGNVVTVGSIAESWWRYIAGNIFATRVGSPLTISGNAISPDMGIHSVGAGLIKNINLPFTGFTGSVTLRPTAAFTYDNTGNILVAGGGGTATVARDMIATFDGSKWAMSY